MAHILEYINSEVTRITNSLIMEGVIGQKEDNADWDKIQQSMIAFGKDIVKEVLGDISSIEKRIEEKEKFTDSLNGVHGYYSVVLMSEAMDIWKESLGGRVEPQVSLPSRTWIKIKDKLPEYDKDVIAIRNCPEPVYKLARLTCGKWTDNKPMWDIDGLDLLLHLEYFDYWMNLPEQPKG